MSSKRRKTGAVAVNLTKENANSSLATLGASGANAVNGATVTNGAAAPNGAMGQDSEAKANGKGISTYEDDIAAELAEQIERVANGTFPKVATAQAALCRELERKIAIADRHRKLQIRNIEDLFVAETIELKARFERATSDIREQTVEELMNEASRQRAALATLAFANSGSNSRLADNSSSSSSLERSLRSAGPQSIAENLSSVGSIGKGDKSNSTNYSAMLSGTKRRAQLPTVASLLDKCLGEEEIRSDFFNIVKDLENRSISFVAKQKASNVALPATTLPSVTLDANGRLAVGSAKYCVGDMVTATSSLSGEPFSGILVVITEHQVVIRSYHGPRFSFLVGQIRSGRVTIAIDTTTPDAVDAMDNRRKV